MKQRVFAQQATPINLRGWSDLIVSPDLARGPTRTKEGRRSEGGQGLRVSLVINDFQPGASPQLTLITEYGHSRWSGGICATLRSGLRIPMFPAISRRLRQRVSGD